MVQRGHHIRRLVGVLACLVLILAGCGSDATGPGTTGAQALSPLRIAIYPSASTLPVHAAISRGIFERNGLKIELTEGQNLPVFTAALAKGRYDIAMSGPTLVLIGAEKGLDLQVVASMQLSSRGQPNAVWITRDPSITSLTQLKSKTIAVPSLTGIIIDSVVYLLQRGGIRRDEVRFVQIPFATMGDQLAAGQIDAAVASLPFSDAITARGFQPRTDVIVDAVVKASEGTVETAMTSVWAASGAFTRTHPDAVRAWRRSLTEAIDFLEHNEADARIMMQDWLKIPAQIVDRSPLPDWGIDVTPTEFAPYVQIARAVGSIKHDPDVASLVWQGP